jgi:hypothetical protein
MFGTHIVVPTLRGEAGGRTESFGGFRPLLGNYLGWNAGTRHTRSNRGLKQAKIESHPR